MDLSKAIADGGGTFAPNGRQMFMRSGYMVSVKDYETKCTNTSELGVMFIKLSDTARKLGAYVGLWRDDVSGIWYVDISKRIPTKEKAVDFGKANDQLAIYDLRRGVSVML